MVALMFSEFAPTARFGYMMCSMLMAAVVGDLILLPVLLQLLPTKMFANFERSDGVLNTVRRRWFPAPHFESRRGRKRNRRRASEKLKTNET